VALVFHGSEIRDPDRHAARFPYSPFNLNNKYSIDRELLTKLRQITHKLRRQAEQFDGPVFVTTHDLLTDVPGAQWLPVVVDIDKWAPAPVRIGEYPPRVVMIPTNGALKGSGGADDVCWPLHGAGVIDYQPLEGVPPDQMVETIAQADVLIDGLVLGAYGRTAIEAMATQRLVIGNVEAVVDAVEGLPIVHADPGSLERTLIEIAENPDPFRSRAEDGRRYVERYHDGTYAATVLGEFLGLEPSGS
jgi:hypothetical protein